MRIDQLTFTRFLAAISIVIFHYGGNSIPFNHSSINFIFKGADIGVSYFFILSGFVMMVAYGEKSTILKSDYYLNRFARIYPLYFLAFFLVLIQQLIKEDIDFFGLFLNILMIQAWFPDKVLSLNSPGWSLSVELIFYLIFPFLFNKFYNKINLNKIMFFIILFWIMSQVLFYYSSFPDWNNKLSYVKEFSRYNPLMHLNQFFIGNIAGLFFIRYLKFKTGNYDLLIMVLVGLIIIALKFESVFDYHNGLLAVLFIPLIILISLNIGIITKIFKNKILVFLGEISYGIYIFQFPIYSFVSFYSIKKYFNIYDVTFAFFFRLLILILFSAIIHIYVEKPLQNKIKKLYLKNKL